MATDPKALTIYRGDSYPITFTLTAATTKLPLDLTGASLLLTVSTDQNPVDDTTELFQLTGVIDTDPATGKVVFTPSSAHTNQTPAKYYYDVQLSQGAAIRTVVKSTFTVTQDISK